MEADLERVSAERDRLRAESEAFQTEIARRITARQEAERRYRDDYTCTDVGHAAIGLNGVILECNTAFAMAMGVEGIDDLRGRRITAFTHLDDRAYDADVLTTLSLGARPRAWIVKRRLDGASQLLQYSAACDDDGEPTGIFVRDASELLDAMRRAENVLASHGAGLDADPAWRAQLAAVLQASLPLG